MVASSYPRFHGDTVGTFMEPIARGIAARGHEVHLLLPWHPRWSRPAAEGGVQFHLFKYAPLDVLNVFGYAGALRADVSLKAAAVAATPLAIVAAAVAIRRLARRLRPTIVHGHWVVPGGALAAASGPAGVPLVVSLHGSDVYMAERHRAIGRVARWTFDRARFVTACSDDLRRRAYALGASDGRSATIPYGVDADRFRPDAGQRRETRAKWNLAADDEVIFAAGRFVRKKGFEYLIAATAALAARRPRLRLVLAGGGDLEPELRRQISTLRLTERTVLPGVLSQDAVGLGMAAADVVAVPSVHDDAGNVDGLPNVVLEALATATPVVATPVGGIASVVRSDETGLLVPERDANALTYAVETLLEHRASAERIGRNARDWVRANASWELAAARFEEAYGAATEGRPIPSA
jgi:glycosyltransferase involved in cell wall biosynthesis